MMLMALFVVVVFLVRLALEFTLLPLACSGFYFWLAIPLVSVIDQFVRSIVKSR